MNAINAHSTRVPSLQPTSVIAHMPRSSKDGGVLDEAPGAWPANSNSSVIDGHHFATNPPIAFVGNFLVNGIDLHAHAAEAIAQSNPAQHAHDLALLVCALGSEIDEVVRAMMSAQNIRGDRLLAALDRLRGQ